jgi:uncharacterized repeat protein (TIGR02543 family)
MVGKKNLLAKKCISVMLGIMMVLAFMPVFSTRAHAATALTQTSGEISSGDYELTGNLEATGTLVIPAGADVTIDLKENNVNNWKAFVTFQVYGKFTIKNSIEKGDWYGKVRGGSSGSSPSRTPLRAVSVESGGEFVLEGGDISYAQSTGVEVKDGGKFTMTGGTISGNASSHSSGTNTYSAGAGVFIYKGGEFTMQGGAIKNNTVTGSGAGGVFNAGTFTMNGGSIVGNQGGQGGGVGNAGSYPDNAIFTMNGGVISQNRSVRGGGVYNNSGIFTMNGGTISLNNGKNLPSSIGENNRFGGGVYNSSKFVMNGGKITRNYGVDTGGGVDTNSSSFEMKGGSIINNSALKNGGGVYYEGGTMTLSGNPVIKDNHILPDNAQTEEDNDLELRLNKYSSMLFTLGDLTSGAEIGVFKAGTDDVIPISNAVTDTSKLEPSVRYFFSNRDEYIVAADQDRKCLVLRKPQTFTVSFDTDGGSTVASQSVKERSKAAEPEAPTKERKTFDGWYTDSEYTVKYDFDTPVTSDLTLYAKWKDSGSGSGGSGGSGGGTTIVYPQDPQPGAIVTITPNPKDGYEAEEVTVTDSSGNAIDVTKNDDGTYTFIQPAGNVTIHVNYVKKDETKPAVKRTQLLNLKAAASGSTSEKLTWNKISGASGYDVWFAKCSRNLKKVGSTKKLSLLKKGLKKGTIYKYKVRAYKYVNGRKVYISTSLAAHAVAGGYNKTYTDAGKITVSKKTMTLSTGSAAAITARQTKSRSGRKFLKTVHAPFYRYRSTDTQVAAVSSTGKVTAKKAGTCKIYIYAQNGLAALTTITVK